jgi:hypothetical protein
MNMFQKWVIEAMVIQHRQLKHLDHKLDILLQHLGAQLPPELVKSGHDLATKTKNLQAALDAQASQEEKPTKKETV